FDTVHPDEREDHLASNQKAFHDRKPFLWQGRFIIGGELCWLHVESTPEVFANGDTRWFGIIQDITDRKVAETALRQSEQKYRNFLNNLDDGAYETDDKGNLTYVNKRTMVITGKKAEDLLEKPFFALFTKESQVLAMDAHIRSMNGEDIGPYELEVKEGAICQFKNSLLRDKNNKVIGIFGIMRDITKQRRAEKALEESEKKFRTLFDTSPQASALTDIETGKIFDVNETLCRLSKFAKNELIGKTTTELGFYSQDARNRFIHELKTRGSVDGMEMDFRIKDGSVFNSRIFAVPIQIGDKRYILTSFYDVTEVNRMQDLVQQSERLQAIATLAGGVAHEFNNALTSMMGNMELLRLDFPEHEECNGYFEEMKQSGLRMSHLTRQLLAYARGGQYQAKLFELAEFVEENISILQHHIKSSVRIETHFSEHKIFVKADLTQMQLILSALVTNSDEAMDNGGTIRLTVRKKNVEKAFSKAHFEIKPGDYACLTIQDNGKGMSDEEKDKLFDPFFTTKFQGRGMGMAAVYGIVKNHDGWIFVDSKLGKGTTVSIYLPIAEMEG
ncbi:MAG: PAS domain S-box protein, partial [Desulfotignum sp.]